MATYKGPTSQNFKYLLRNNRLYFFQRHRIIFSQKRKALHYSNENSGFDYLTQDNKMPQTRPQLQT